MISRRLIRIKVLQILYAFFSSPENSINAAEKELFFSLQKTYDLYHYLMDLVIELQRAEENRIELRRNKHRPTYEDLHPNNRFINNRLILQLKNNDHLINYLEKSKLNWVNQQDLVKKLYSRLTDSEHYQEYMKAESNSYKDDHQFVEYIFASLILESEEIESLLEEQSIFWNDDLDFVVSMIIKTFNKFKVYTQNDQPLMPIFKDDEDRLFAKELFRKAILNHEENIDLVKKHTVNWDVERIAFVDNLILELALTEFLYFPSIPTKVTLNEYIELSKYYSTEKSRNFINGILDKALKDLKKSDKVVKIGRGLIGENED